MYDLRPCQRSSFLSVLQMHFLLMRQEGEPAKRVHAFSRFAALLRTRWCF